MDREKDRETYYTFPNPTPAQPAPQLLGCVRICGILNGSG